VTPVPDTGKRVGNGARRARAETGPGVPDGAHEWVSFPDPDEDRTWVFDVTFLLSGWECIWGRGCQGVLTAPAEDLAQGCCSYAAHFTDRADRRRVEKAAARLTPANWQFAKAARRNGTLRVTKLDRAGEPMTRLAAGACIFLNRPGFSGGPGCALHTAALAAGERPMDWKPDVCWQLPLRRDDETDASGHVTTTVSQWERRHWGKGGAEFHWWCTEAPEAFGGRQPVFVSLREELVGIVGPKVYALLAAELDRRRSAQRAPLPHPAAPQTVSVSLGRTRLRGARQGKVQVAVPDRDGSSGSASSSNSSVARHQEAWSSSGSAPHSGQGSSTTSLRRFRARASSKRR